MLHCNLSPYWFYRVCFQLILNLTLLTLTWIPYPVLSVRFEVGVSLSLAPAGADKRDPKAPFPLVENAEIQLAICKRVPTGAPVGAWSYWKHCIPHLNLEVRPLVPTNVAWIQIADCILCVRVFQCVLWFPSLQKYQLIYKFHKFQFGTIDELWLCGCSPAHSQLLI